MQKMFLNVWFLVFALCVSAQQYNIQTKHYGIEDGLAHRSVRSVIQDKKGFIWVVGENAGLSRFDGYSFTHFTKAENGLSDDDIVDIAEAPDGMLWLFCKYDITARCLDVFNPVTEKAIPFKEYFKGKLPANFPLKYSGYAIDADGRMYMGCASPPGVAIYDPHAGFTFKPLAFAGPVTVNFLAGNKLLFLSVSESNTALAFDKNTWKAVEQKNGCRYLPTYAKHQTGYANIYYGPGQSYALVSSADVVEKKLMPLLKKYSTRGNTVCTFLDSAKNLFLADSLIFDLNTGTLLLNIKDIIPSYINTWTITGWLIDRTGALWLGSEFGLTRISITPNKFKQLLFNGHADQKGISARGMVVLPDSSLLVNTENNAQYRLFSSGKSVFFVNPTKSPLSTFGWGKDGLANIYYFDKSESHLLSQSLAGNEKKYAWPFEHPFWCMFFIDKYHFWAGTVLGHDIVVGDIRNEHVKTEFNYNGFDELKTVGSYYMHRSHDGSIWICAESGLYKADTDKGVIARYWTGGQGKFKLPVDHILHCYEDSEGIFWLATFDKGLVRWNPITGNAICYGLQAGLPCQTVYCVYEDSHGQLWLSSEKGILQFDKTRGHITRIYSTGDGITNIEFNRISHCRSAAGTLYFGGLNGVTSFNPDSFYNVTNNLAPLALVKFSKYDSKQSAVVDITSQYLNTKAITLQPGDRFLILDVALLSYNHNNEIKYAYRFDNDSIWVYQNTPRIQFAGMPYGNHVIHIRALSVNGLPGQNELSVLVKQLKPVYLRVWFLLLILLVLVTGAAFYTRYRVRYLRKRQKEIELQVKTATAHIAEQAEEIQHLSNLKTRFFTNVSHELRTPLTLINGPISSLLKNENLDEQGKKQLSSANYHAKQLLQLTNELLDLSKLDAGKMNLNETAISLQPFVNRIFLSFESHAEQSGIKMVFNYNINYRLQINTDSHKLAKIINNLVSNAVKFTPPGGQVGLTVTERENLLIIEVADNGQGIDSADLPFVFDRFYQTSRTDAPYQGGTGIGLTISRDFARLIGGELSVTSQLGKGSVFTLTLLKKEVPDLPGSDKVHNNIAVSSDDKTNVAGISESGKQVYTILIVEDNEAVREYLQQILPANYKIITARNGGEGIKYLVDNTALPHLILSDVMMPVMDGFKMLEIIKADNRLRQIPVIMLTARGEMRDKLQALRIGVDDYLLKPFEEEELLARISNLLKNYAARFTEIADINELRPENADEKLANITATEEESIITQHDQAWLANIELMVAAKLSDPALSVELLAKDLAMSRSTFLRQLKRLTGLTPTQYIDEMRFNTARTLLENRQVDSVKAAAYSVGFLQVEHFSRSFYKRFGKYPSAYLS